MMEKNQVSEERAIPVSEQPTVGPETDGKVSVQAEISEISTILSEWEFYKKSVYPEGFSCKAQSQQVRQGFFAGAFVALSLLHTKGRLQSIRTESRVVNMMDILLTLKDEAHTECESDAIDPYNETKVDEQQPDPTAGN